MKRHTYLAILAVAVFTLRAAVAYPTGNMTCSDIGDFAATTVEGKQNGQTLKEALAKVNKATADYPLERKNMIQIVRSIYTADWAKHLSVDGARAAFTADCEVQQ